MSRSKKFTALIPQPVAEAIDHEFEKCGYSSANAMIVGLARYHLLIGKPHPLTSGIAKLSRTEQDDVDDFLLEVTKRGIALRGQFLERLLAGILDGTEHTKDDVAALLPGTLLALARRWKAGEDVWPELG